MKKKVKKETEIKKEKAKKFLDKRFVITGFSRADKKRLKEKIVEELSR